jgi:hypothetical protein
MSKVLWRSQPDEPDTERITEVTSENIERVILNLENIGDAQPGELAPNPENYTVAQKAMIVRSMTLNVAKLQIWLDIVELIIDPDERIALLQALLERRILECCQIISALQTVN